MDSRLASGHGKTVTAVFLAAATDLAALAPVEDVAVVLAGSTNLWCGFNKAVAALQVVSFIGDLESDLAAMAGFRQPR